MAREGDCLQSPVTPDLVDRRSQVLLQDRKRENHLQDHLDKPMQGCDNEGQVHRVLHHEDEQTGGTTFTKISDQ